MCESGARIPALVESCAMSTVVWRMIASIKSFVSISEPRTLTFSPTRPGGARKFTGLAEVTRDSESC